MAIKFKSDYDERYHSPDVSEVTVNGVPLGKRVEKKEFSPVTIFLWLASAAAFIMMVHALAPVAAFFVGTCLVLLLILFVFVPTILTLGLIWVSESYKRGVNNIYGMLGALEGDGIIQQALDFLAKSYWYALFIGGSIILIAIVWSVIDFKVEPTVNRVKKNRMMKIIGSASVFVLTAIFAGIFLVAAQS